MARSRIELVILLGLFTFSKAAVSQEFNSPGKVIGSAANTHQKISNAEDSRSNLTIPAGKINLSLPVDTLYNRLKDNSIFKLPVKDIQRQWNDALTRIAAVKEEGRKLLHHPISLDDATLNYTGVTDNSYIKDNSSYYFNNTLASTSWTLAGIPLEVSYRHQDWSAFAIDNNNNNLTIRFDRDIYMTALKNKLANKIEPLQFLDQLKDPLASLKAKALSDLRSEFTSINQQYKELLSDKINAIGDLNTLFNKDIISLRQQLLSNDYIQTIQQQQNQLAQLVQQRNNGKLVDPAQISTLENSISASKGLEELVNKVAQHQQKWKATGLISKMKEWELLKDGQLRNFLNNPSVIGAIAKKKLNLSAFQRFFLKVNKLNAGQQAVSASPLSLQHLMSKGLSTEFLNNNKYLLLFAGKLNNNRSTWDMPFTENINSPTGSAKAIRVGKGGSGGSHSHISIMSFEQSFQPYYAATALPVTWRSLVTTISNQIPVGSGGMMKAELSRSATNFVNDPSGNSALGKIASGNNLMSNMAFSLAYEDEYPAVGLNYQVHVSHTARGYDNPGNPYLNGGSEAGYRVRKSFWKNKLLVSVRTDLREYRYSEEIDNKWTNTYTVMDVRWRVKKGQFITLRYMPNRMKRVDQGHKQTVTAIDRLSAETSLSGKLWKKVYRNYISVSYQGNQYLMGTENMHNRSLLFSSFQSLAISRKLVYINTTYNNSSNHTAFAYFNSSLMMESGITYQLLRRISASSAIVYNSVADWYTQGGFRQTFSGQLSDKFNLNLYVDARKNFRLYQPLLTGPVRADISLQYLFKK